jgi:hypothetical protein
LAELTEEAAWRLLEKLQAAGAKVEDMRASSSRDYVRSAERLVLALCQAQTEERDVNEGGYK